MTDRTRRGRHKSVAGEPADATLSDLVDQFSDRYAFVRELIQNSLDAGALRVDVAMSYRDKELCIEVIDDGEGMDLATIEGYLLTLFRSTKEDDLTKIGKFGIGFVSLFAMDPREVVVDTGRDGVWHRVIFDEFRSYTLLEMPDPFEGTTVRLRIRCNGKQALARAIRVRAGAVRWCRFIEGDIHTSFSGHGQGWKPTPVRAPFHLEGPVVVRLSEDGVEAVLAIDPSLKPNGCFLNHGLTLWEGPTSLMPGVRFLVKGRHLEHTLTRDDVRRDRHFRHVMSRLAQGEHMLQEAVEDALSDAAGRADLDRLRAVTSALAPGLPWTWREDRPLLPAVGRDPVALDDLTSWGGWLRRVVGAERPPLLVSPADHPLGLALAQQGQVVLVGEPTDAHVRWVSSVLDDRGVLDVRDHYVHPWPAEASPEAADLLEAANRLEQERGGGITLVAARFTDGGTHLKGRLAWGQDQATSLEEVDDGARRHGPQLAIDIEHDLLDSLAQVPAAVGALMLLRAATADAGLSSPPHTETFQRVAAALRTQP